MKIKLFFQEQELPFLKDQGIDFKETGIGAISSLIEIEVDFPDRDVDMAALVLKMYAAGCQSGLRKAFKSRDNYESVKY